MVKIYRLSLLIVLLLCFQTANAEWVKQATNSFSWFRDVIFVNEHKGWISGTDGTLMTTDDGGASWTAIRKFTTDAIVQIHFSDEMTGWLLCQRNVYARGKDASSYLRKTIDGGITWEKIEFEYAGRERVTKLLFNKAGGATAFGEGGIFYKLQEDGRTWKKTVTAIHFVLLDGAYADDSLGAIVGAGGSILFTENTGLSWDNATLMERTDAKINAVFFAGRKAAWAVGSGGTIFHSTGGGRLWRLQDSGTNANLNDVYFTNSSNGWAVGDNGTIIRTRNGGSTWYDVSSHVTHRLEKIVFNGAKGWAVGFGGTLLSYDDSVSNTDPGTKPTLQKRN